MEILQLIVSEVGLRHATKDSSNFFFKVLKERAGINLTTSVVDKEIRTCG